MALSTKDLLIKNQTAFKHNFYIESVYLSYSLINRELKHIIQKEKIAQSTHQMKLSDAIKQMKIVYEKNPLFTKKLKKSIFKGICEFNSEYKLVTKEMKYHYPEIQLKNCAKKGLDVLVKLNTSLIKLHFNSKT